MKAARRLAGKGQGGVSPAMLSPGERPERGGPSGALEGTRWLKSDSIALWGPEHGPWRAARRSRQRPIKRKHHLGGKRTLGFRLLLSKRPT